MTIAHDIHKARVELSEALVGLHGQLEDSILATRQEARMRFGAALEQAVDHLEEFLATACEISPLASVDSAWNAGKAFGTAKGAATRLRNECSDELVDVRAWHQESAIEYEVAVARLGMQDDMMTEAKKAAATLPMSDNPDLWTDFIEIMKPFWPADNPPKYVDEIERSIPIMERRWSPLDRWGDPAAHALRKFARRYKNEVGRDFLTDAKEWRDGKATFNHLAYTQEMERFDIDHTLMKARMHHSAMKKRLSELEAKVDSIPTPEEAERNALRSLVRAEFSKDYTMTLAHTVRMPEPLTEEFRACARLLIEAGRLELEADSVSGIRSGIEARIAEGAPKSDDIIYPSVANVSAIRTERINAVERTEQLAAREDDRMHRLATMVDKEEAQPPSPGMAR